MHQCLISLMIAVKLVVQLKIIHVEDDKGQGSALAFYVIFLQCLAEIFPVQKSGKLICPGFLICLFVEPGVLYRNGADGFNGVKEYDVLLGIPPGTHLSPLLLAPHKHQSGQVVPALKRQDTLNLKDLHLVFFFLPHGLVFHGPAEVLKQQAGIMVF